MESSLNPPVSARLTLTSSGLCSRYLIRETPATLPKITALLCASLNLLYFPFIAHIIPWHSYRSSGFEWNFSLVLTISLRLRMYLTNNRHSQIFFEQCQLFCLLGDNDINYFLSDSEGHIYKNAHNAYVQFKVIMSKNIHVLMHIHVLPSYPISSKVTNRFSVKFTY